MTSKRKRGRPRSSQLPLSEIYYDSDFNCRGQFTIQSILPLSESIKELGLLEPITVQPYVGKKGKKYRIICGHRRFKAVEFLKWKTVQCQIIEGLTEDEARLLNVTENIERRDLTIMEEAKALAVLFPKGESLREIAKKINRDTKWIHRRQKLLKAPKEVQEAADAGRVSEYRLDKILLMPTHAQQVKCLNLYLSHDERYIPPGASNIDRASQNKPSKKVGRGTETLPTKADYAELITTMLDATIVGLGPRALAYAAGWITKADILRDIELLKSGKRLSAVVKGDDDFDDDPSEHQGH